MARAWRNRRRIVVAVITIVVSILLIAVGAPRVLNTPQQGGTLQKPVPLTVRGATSSTPGHSVLQLPNVSSNVPFSVAVSANGTASFCVLSDSAYSSWISSPDGFHWDQCLVQKQEIRADTLTFTPPSKGTWDVVVVNTNRTGIKVDFLPV